MKTTASQIRVVCARGMRLRAERRPHEQTADPRRRAGEEHTEHDGDTQYDTSRSRCNVRDEFCFPTPPHCEFQKVSVAIRGQHRFENNLAFLSV